MNRKLFNLGALCAVCALAVEPSSAFAGGKGKSDRSAFSQSMGGNSGGNSAPMKLHSSRSKSFSTGNSNGNLNASMFNKKSLAKKSPKSLGQFQSNGSSLPNMYSTGGGNGNSGIAGHLNGKKHKFKPTDSGIGDGTGGDSIKWPGKFTTTEKNSQIADAIKKHKFLPVEGIRIGEPNGPGNGNGNGPGNGKGKGKNKDCHDFPWWPIIVGGCYNGGGYNNGGNCHHHHDCYDNYHGGCYNGGYNNVVTYPSVTNIVIEAPPVDPAAAAQPALVAGIDLELLNVQLVDAGDAARNLGPRYRLTFGNRGTELAGNFQVMLMASADGKPQAGAPMATTEVANLASRQVFSADVRLPLSAELPTLGKCIVVIDSAAQIGEPDENNNVAVLDREKIATIDPTTVAVQ